MSLTIASRSALIRGRFPTVARSLHTSNPVRSAHGEYHHLPFAWPHEAKTSFALKLTAYLGFGFALPFVAAAYQLNKSA